MGESIIKAGSRIMVMRYNSVSGVDFVKAHNDVTATQGACWMLKLGHKIPSSSLNQTIDAGGALILRTPKKEGDKYFLCRLLGYHQGSPTDEMKYPTYYEQIFQGDPQAKDGSWIRIGEINQLNCDVARGLKLLKNDKPLHQALAETRTVVLYVYSDSEIVLAE